MVKLTILSAFTALLAIISAQGLTPNKTMAHSIVYPSRHSTAKATPALRPTSHAEQGAHTPRAAQISVRPPISLIPRQTPTLTAVHETTANSSVPLPTPAPTKHEPLSFWLMLIVPIFLGLSIPTFIVCMAWHRGGAWFGKMFGRRKPQTEHETWLGQKV